MPWKDTTTMSQRTELIERAKLPDANLSALCREYQVSRKTLYKWLQRERAAGAAGLCDRSRRPKRCPGHTSAAVEAQVVQLRAAHPAWGGRKIHRRLADLGVPHLPAPSTITAILQRQGQIDPQAAIQHHPFRRFARERPNELWQMDFKGYFALPSGGTCHPLTVLDDHSRFLVGLKACPNETYATVQHHLSAIFEQYGLPERMLMDNGAPWGDDRDHPYTVLTVWLLRLGVAISHGRPYHPQTQGKDERLHRTLRAEVLTRYALASLAESQERFDAWREIYNTLRPHEALQLETPSTRYQPSPRPFPHQLPPVSYAPGTIVRIVDETGKISFHTRRYRVGKAFRHQPVGLSPTQTDGLFQVCFCQQPIAQINLREDNC